MLHCLESNTLFYINQSKMNIRYKVKYVLKLVKALLVHANAQAAEIVIDDFSTNQGPISDTVVDGAKVLLGGVSEDIVISIFKKWITVKALVMMIP